jgi:hypothetical protein
MPTRPAMLGRHTLQDAAAAFPEAGRRTSLRAVANLAPDREIACEAAATMAGSNRAASHPGDPVGDRRVREAA